MPNGVLPLTPLSVETYPYDVLPFGGVATSPLTPVTVPKLPTPVQPAGMPLSKPAVALNAGTIKQKPNTPSI